MAQTTGIVWRVTWVDDIACVRIGPTPEDLEAFVVRFVASDSRAARAGKKGLAHILTAAAGLGFTVSVSHDDDSSEIRSLAVGDYDISPNGPAIHGDFYAISGRGFPDDARVLFQSATLEVEIVPDFMRPHLVVIEELPASVPVGANTVQIVNAGGTFASDAFPVLVSSEAPCTMRVLHSGAPKAAPYTILFIANPVLVKGDPAVSAPPRPDPLITDRPSFHDTVGFALRNLFMVAEDVLRREDIDSQMRLVTIFDPSLPVTDANALVAEDYIDGSLMIYSEANKLNAFVARYGEKPDVVFSLSGSTFYTRSSAWPTVDDPQPGSLPFVFDGVALEHAAFNETPGSTAMSIYFYPHGLTALHEFMHAASDFYPGGHISDLYVDTGGMFLTINKKHRASAGDAVPTVYTVMDTRIYTSDPTRDGLGYGTWTSYHPELIDPTRPNVMDAYLETAIPQLCRLDRLTYDYLWQRLLAKVYR